MSEEESFLAAICADPDDDTVRLAFADWLQERDQPARAEFVRLQIERARYEESNPLPVIEYGHSNQAHSPRGRWLITSIAKPPDHLPTGRLYRMVSNTLHRSPWTGRYVGPYRKGAGASWEGEFEVADRPEVKKMRDRERELLGSWGYGSRIQQWSEPMAATRAQQPSYDQWNRGFLETVVMGAGDWVEWADRLTVRLPLRNATLIGWPQLKRRRTREEYQWGGDKVYWLGDRREYRDYWLKDLKHSPRNADWRTPDYCRALLGVYWPKITFTFH